MAEARFDRGVAYYTLGTGTITVAFPEDATCCRYCRYLRADANGVRHKCVLTEEILLRIDFRGGQCPLKFKEATT